MSYDPLGLQPPKNLIKEVVKGLQSEAVRLLADIASLRQNPVADWLVSDLEARHKQLVHKIKRYQLYLKGVPVAESATGSEDKLIAKRQSIVNLFPGKLRKSGGRWYGRCPLHPDDRPSFVIYQNNSWFCFAGCGGGDSIDFVMRKENISFPEAIKFLTNYN